MRIKLKPTKAQEKSLELLLATYRELMVVDEVDYEPTITAMGSLHIIINAERYEKKFGYVIDCNGLIKDFRMASIETNIFNNVSYF